MNATSPTLVVLDGHTLNPGDLDWAPLRALVACRIHPRSSDAEVLDRAAGAALVLINKVRFRAATMDALPDLRYIGVCATGYDCVDTQAARERGIVVTNVPAYGTASVAQMVFAHILEHTQNVAVHAATVREGRWAASPDFCYWERPLVELEGRILGIIGMGRIGAAVARIGLAFGMVVIAHDAPEVLAKAPQVQAVSLEELFRQSDILTLHCPLTDATRGLVDRDRLAMMKPTAYLVNTSRGGLIDEPALAEALAQGRLAGAGLDVLTVEPPSPGNVLVRAPGATITPHIAWATVSARQRLLDIVVDNIRAFLAGTPRNVVG